MTVNVVKKEDSGSRVHLIKAAKLKADTRIVVNDNLQYEDDFGDLYISQKNPSHMLIEPPFNPVTLQGLVTRNNILAQCIQAMEVNIDGTGHTIEPMDESKLVAGEESAPNRKKLEAFFSEPYPEVSMIGMRRKLRYDLESTGNAYIEVIRNINRDIVFLRWIDCTTMRLVKLDDPVSVEKEIVRGGERVKANVLVRERRFAQKVGENLLYFREFGSSRMINRNNGKWATGEGQVGLSDLGSEIIHMTLEKDVKTAYGIPRWINQLPSVLGSRKAEEFNLEFFDNGGVPPAAIFIQGGALVQDVKTQMEGYFGGGNGKARHRVAIIEVQSTGGSLDSPGNVQVKTERFGDSRMSDGMFQNYDARSEEHVRIGFRLPPLFVGRAQDYNFATAETAYMVTEAQVFRPERMEFDDIINTKVVRAMGIQDFKFVSKGLTIKNVQLQLDSIDKVKEMIDGEELVATVNDITGLNLKFSQEALDASKALQQAQIEATTAQAHATTVAAGAKPTAPGDKAKPNAGPGAKPTAKPAGKPKLQVVKGVSDATDLSPEQIVLLVDKWAQAMGLTGQGIDPAEAALVMETVDKLDYQQRGIFDNVLASKAFSRLDVDPDGIAELAGCCAHLIEVN